jgi:endonuclease-8
VPEGDTIFQTAAALRPLLVGQTIQAASARTPGPQMQRVVGSQVTAIEPLGKHMVIHFDNGLALHTHLRMKGTWHRYAPGERWKLPSSAARAVLEVPGHVVVCFLAPVVELMDERAVDLHPAMAALGPDLLRDDFVPDDAFARLRGQPDLEIADALLDQRLMAGIGNVFKSEILFVEGINPWTRVRTLDDDQLRSIVATSRRLLLMNRPEPGAPIKPERVTTRGDAAARGASVYVYGRLNRPCVRCGGPIRVRRQGAMNRPTYWCPRCQPGTASADVDEQEFRGRPARGWRRTARRSAAPPTDGPF